MRDELMTKLRELVDHMRTHSAALPADARGALTKREVCCVQLRDVLWAEALETILDAHDPAGDGVPTEPGWRCSGCGHVLWGSVGECKGYCQDSSGASCDAVACPSCGRFHYWTAAGVQRIEPKSRQGATDSMREDLLAESTTAVEPGQCPTCKAFGVPA